MQATKNHILLYQSIVKTLLYYDIFNYPLTANEVCRFTSLGGITEADVAYALNALVARNILFQFEEFYSLQPQPGNIARRKKGNAEAEKYLHLARKQARLIGSFPFVRAVMASGSLSKGYMDDRCDLDFFIITQPNRLWISRILLVMYKRIFLFNNNRFFCVNYFIDSNHLPIEEKNIFTATELATVIPLFGPGYYERLLKENAWVKDFFPNYSPRSTADVIEQKARSIKPWLERLIDRCGSERLNHFFMTLTLERWKKKYAGQYTDADFEVAFKSKRHTSKSHPRHYQKKITELYVDKIDEFSKRFDLASYE